MFAFHNTKLKFTKDNFLVPWIQLNEVLKYEETKFSRGLYAHRNVAKTTNYRLERGIHLKFSFHNRCIDNKVASEIKRRVSFYPMLNIRNISNMI